MAHITQNGYLNITAPNWAWPATAYFSLFIWFFLEYREKMYCNTSSLSSFEARAIYHPQNEWFLKYPSLTEDQLCPLSVICGSQKHWIHSGTKVRGSRPSLCGHSKSPSEIISKCLHQITFWLRNLKKIPKTLYLSFQIKLPSQSEGS